MNEHTRTGTRTPIAVGVAGLGRSGWDLHCAALSGLPELFSVAGVFDAESARRREAVARFGCAEFDSLDGLLADPGIELAVIALPSHLHESAALAAIQADRHVVVEKPFATSAAGAERMVAAARAAGRIITCSNNMRFTSAFLKLREVVSSGVLGPLVQVRIAWNRFRRRWDWQTSAALGGGVLNNDGSHIVDQALLLFGESEPQVNCWKTRTPLTVGDAENHVKIVLYGSGRPIMDLEMTDSCACPQTTWQVMGTYGGLWGGAEGLEWRYIDPGALPPRTQVTRPTEDRSYNSENLAWRTEACSFKDENLYEASFRHFYTRLFSAVREGAAVPVSGESILRQIRVLEECRCRGIDS